MKTFDNCRLYPTENGFLIIVKDSSDEQAKGYLNYKTVVKKLQSLAATPEEKDAAGQRLHKATSFTLTFNKDVETVVWNEKDYYALDEVKVKKVTLQDEEDDEEDED